MTLKRMTFLQELLSFIGLGERLHFDWISSAEAGKFADVTRAFTRTIRSLGPNPISGYRLDEWLTKVQEKNGAAKAGLQSALHKLT